MEVAEGWLGEELLGHFGFLNELLEHRGGRLPEVVSHFNSNSNYIIIMHTLYLSTLYL